MFNLTPDLLRKIAPHIPNSPTSIADVVNSLNLICPKYGIGTADIFHEFLARVLVESGQFTRFSENLNYSAQGLANTFPTRYAKDPHQKVKVPNSLAIGLQRNPIAIANNCYANRMGNGDEASGDGWKFRGAGPIQITGKDETTTFLNYFNKEFGTIYTLDQISTLLRTNFDIGIHSACWLFAISKNLIQLAADDNIKEIVHRINGGYNGLDDTVIFLEAARKYIKDF